MRLSFSGSGYIVPPSSMLYDFGKVCPVAVTQTHAPPPENVVLALEIIASAHRQSFWLYEERHEMCHRMPVTLESGVGFSPVMSRCFVEGKSLPGLD